MGSQIQDPRDEFSTQARQKVLIYLGAIVNLGPQLLPDDRQNLETAVSAACAILLPDTRVPRRSKLPAVFADRRPGDPSDAIWRQILGMVDHTISTPNDNRAFEGASAILERACSNAALGPRTIDGTSREILDTLLSLPAEANRFGKKEFHELNERIPRALDGLASPMGVDPSLLDDVTDQSGTDTIWGERPPATRDDRARLIYLVTFQGRLASTDQASTEAALGGTHESLRQLMTDIGARGATEPISEQEVTKASSPRS